jgi:glycosyl transferase family 25
MQSIKKFVINLKRRPDRLEAFQKNCPFTDVEVVHGFDGKYARDEQSRSEKDMIYKCKLTPGEIGVFISHLRIYKKILELDVSHAMIFEDDAVFEPNFKNNFDLCFKHTPSDFDIFYIGCFFNNNTLVDNMFCNTLFRNCKKEEIYINQHIKIPNFFLGLHSYLISRKGAEKLVNYIDKNISTHIDATIYKLFSDNKLTIYSTVERLVYQTSTDDRKTSFNSSNNFPLIIDYLTSFIELDRKVRMNHGLLCPFKTINGFNINPITYIFIILGILLHRIPVHNLLIAYIFLTLPDIVQFKYIYEFFVIGLIFLFPALFFQTML